MGSADREAGDRRELGGLGKLPVQCRTEQRRWFFRCVIKLGSSLPHEAVDAKICMRAERGWAGLQRSALSDTGEKQTDLPGSELLCYKALEGARREMHIFFRDLPCSIPWAW